jgi:hypothetical protein
MTPCIGQLLHHNRYVIDSLLAQKENGSRLGAISERQALDWTTQVSASQTYLAAYRPGERPEEMIP